MTAKIIKFPIKFRVNIEPTDIRYDKGTTHGAFYYTEEKKRFNFTEILNPLNWNKN